MYVVVLGEPLKSGIMLLGAYDLQGPSYYPNSYPTMPHDEILEHPTLQKHVLDLSLTLETRMLFHEASELD